MNTEQLKQLKQGDEIFIRARYKDRLESGAVLFSIYATNAYAAAFEVGGYTHMKNVISSMSSPDNVIKNTETAPKCDPCRMFKKGDKVRVVENKGRKQECSGSLAIVKQDEDKNKVLITIDGSGLWWVDAAYLELVTPVEELNPYYVKETASVYEVFNRNENNSSVAIFFKSQYSIEKAKERAEAECDRLNAEHGKEQNNG